MKNQTYNSVHLESILTHFEAEFVRMVYIYRGAKMNDISCSHWEDDGTEYGKTVNHWSVPEKLGLIECIGSYKWIPTKKLDICIVLDPRT